jgi:hypothetical protein
LISGGSGGSFDGGTIHGALLVQPTSPALAPLEALAPVGTAAGSGTIFEAATVENSGQLAVNADGSTFIQADGAAGLNNDALVVKGSGAYYNAANENLLLRVLNDDGTPVVSVDSGGAVSVVLAAADTAFVVRDLSNGHIPLQVSRNQLRLLLPTVPADGSLADSEFSLWLDATPGATKLMVKAKDSGGTVRTAAIALS